MFGLAFLVACGLYVWMALFVAKQVGKGTGSRLSKYSTLVAFALLPTWDLIPGQLYHEHLCKTEGGVKVFKTIEVEKAYFLPDGRLDEKKLEERVDWVEKPDRTFSMLFHITKNQDLLIDKRTSEQLGTATDFWYYGGWFQASFLHLGGSTICPQYPNYGVSSSLLREVVRPRPDMNLGGQ
jgi:hypothetical protein